MDYQEALMRSKEYMEQNLMEPVEAADIAAAAGYSLYHFSRVFALCEGCSLMEYFRRRRLLRAVEEIKKGTRVIDAAIAYGFASENGFSRAFRREFGCSPTRFPAACKKNTEKGGGHSMQIKQTFIKMPERLLAGYGIQTDVSGTAYTRDIASFWSHYEGENLESKLYRILTPPLHGEVGICVPDKNGKAVYVLGVIVPDFSKVQTDMITIRIPAGEYAVFTTPPAEEAAFAGTIQQVWRYIFEDWFSSSGCRFDQARPEYEFYDERCHPGRLAEMDIYVPVIRG